MGVPDRGGGRMGENKHNLDALWLLLCHDDDDDVKLKQEGSLATKTERN